MGQVTCNGSQFEPPLPGLYGYGSATCFTGGAGAGGGCTAAQALWWAEKFHFNIMDQVLVPRELEAGEYALSFRWGAPNPCPLCARALPPFCARICARPCSLAQPADAFAQQPGA